MTRVVIGRTGEIIEGTPAEVAAAVVSEAERVVRPSGQQLRLFDAKPDAVQLSFGGSVALDPDHDSDTAFVQRAELGRRITLRVTAAVVGGGLVRQEGRKADTDTLTVKLRVESVEIEDATC